MLGVGLLLGCSGGGPQPEGALRQDAASAARADAAVLHLDTGRQLPLTRQIYGFNTENISGVYGVLDTAFVNVVQELQPRVLRFPGGASANFYHWQIAGFRRPEMASTQREKLNARNLANIRRLSNLRGGEMPFEDFMELCQRFGIRPILVVNTYTGTPEESAAWVRYVRERDLEVAGWEIGNEMYSEAYGDVYDSVDTYIADARRHVAAMREADPEIEVSVPVSGTGFHPEAGGERERLREWDRRLAAETFYDAYSVHLYTYPRERRASGLDQRRGLLFGSSGPGLDSALVYYRRLFGDRPMWVTEWNVAEPDNSIANTQLHAMFVGDFFIGLLEAAATIRVATFHVLAGPGKGFTVLSPRAEGDPPHLTHVRRASYYPFRLIGEAIARADSRIGVEVEGGPTLQGAFEFSGHRLPGVRAAALVGDGKIVLLVSNRTGGSVPIEVRADGEAMQGEVRYRYVASPELDATNGGNAVIPGAGTLEVGIQEWRGPASDLTLRANSFGVVELP